jgi:hypothetical protein
MALSAAHIAAIEELLLVFGPSLPYLFVIERSTLTFIEATHFCYLFWSAQLWKQSRCTFVMADQLLEPYPTYETCSYFEGSSGDARRMNGRPQCGTRGHLNEPWLLIEHQQPNCPHVAAVEAVDLKSQPLCMPFRLLLSIACSSFAYSFLCGSQGLRCLHSQDS